MRVLDAPPRPGCLAGEILLSLPGASRHCPQSWPPGSHAEQGILPGHGSADTLPDRRLSLLQGLPPPDPATPPLPLREWLLSWIRQDARPQERPDCLAGYIHHAADAWSRRDAPNVVLAHHADLTANLPGEMSRLAGRLGIMVPASRWPALVSSATFPHMWARAGRLTAGSWPHSGWHPRIIAQPGAACTTRSRW